MNIDFSFWMKRWSTWLALASLSATSGLGAYALMPERVQALVPDWALASLGGIAMGAVILIPVATSIAQPKIEALKSGSPPDTTNRGSS